MTPKITSDNKNFHFNGRLNEEELSIVRSFIGLNILWIRSEGIDINLHDQPISIFLKEDTAIRLSSDSKVIDSRFMVLKSLFDEVDGPIVDQGSVSIEKIERKPIPLREKIKNPPPPLFEKPLNSIIRYPIESPIKRFLFYGHHEEGVLPDTEWKDHNEFYKQEIFTESPLVKADGIDFIIIVHENEQKSMIRVDEHKMFLLESEAFGHHLELKNIIEPYDWSDKNIILQHDIN